MKVFKSLIIFILVIMSHYADAQNSNPFLYEFKTDFGAPSFDKIKCHDYEPAIRAGIVEQNKLIKEIVSNKKFPTFLNTIKALDESSPILNRTTSVFYNMLDANTNDELTAIAMKIGPILSNQNDNIYLNQELFNRVKYVHAHENRLTVEQKRLIDKFYRAFIRSGTNLSMFKQHRLREINKELSKLTIAYSNNVLAENNAFKLYIDNKAELKGLPDWYTKSAENEAEIEGRPGKWLIKLTSDSRIPFLQYSSMRCLRERIYRAYINRCNNNDKFDNKENITKILSLRLEKAKILGFDCFSNYSLNESIAKKSTNVMNLLHKVWKYSLAKAKAEASDLQKMMDKEGKGEKLQAWDWDYYAEKVREVKYNLNEDELKPFFQLENVREGAFQCAHRLYGITFTALKDIPVYAPDIEVFRVNNKDGSLLGILYLDYFPRSGKKGGAWMSNYREEKKGVRPIICNVASFTKPVGNIPSLLTIDEVETVFHEFGHALHGLLTQCNYAGISGTNVSRDFVELFSQINEHWATSPEVLKMYARHYKTGEIIPDSLIDKILKHKTFNQGFITTELLAASFLDMEMHNLKSMNGYSVEKFEKKVMEDIKLIPEIYPRYQSTNFNHIVGGYEAGYYSYIWSNILDCDAFELFKEKGVFDKNTAYRFQHCLLERGDSDDPMKMYKNFRGSEPQLMPLLKSRGLE